MYVKLEGGDQLTVYKDQVSAKEIKKAYDDGKAAAKSKADIIKDMTATIDGQIKKGKYISKHWGKGWRGRSDVRSKGYEHRTEKAEFTKAAEATADFGNSGNNATSFPSAILNGALGCILTPSKRRLRSPFCVMTSGKQENRNRRRMPSTDD